MSSIEETTTPVVINQDFPCPGVTPDYKIVVDSRGGYKVVANRRIKKGETIMENSMEFMFSDVQEGDHMWLGVNRRHQHHDHHHRKSSSNKLAMDKDVPERIPVTRDMLLRTHGVSYVIKKSSKEVVTRTYLESPTMFVNHSCEPSMECLYDIEDRATRDLEVGDEITVDYAMCDYEDVVFIGDCLCGAPSCRGKVLGYSSLSAEDKEKHFSALSPPIAAEYLEDIGKGPPVREVEDMIPRPLATSDSDVAAMRLFWPGPSWTEANVMVKKDENSNQYGLYATKNVPKGKRFYGFWRYRWPQGEKTLIDMVFAPPVNEEWQEGDIQEGTVVRLDANKCGSYRNAKGQMMFSGWEMLNAHSCDPNAVYRNRDSDEHEDWQWVFAAKDIKKGERITMDWNCFTFDRGDCPEMAVCHCGAENCVGTKQGFKYLSPEAQTERSTMTWLHKAAAAMPAKVAGEALSPFVRAMSQPKAVLPNDDEATDTQSSTSFSDSSSSDNKED